MDLKPDDLKLGEVICDKCNGSGTYIHEIDEPFNNFKCPKCQGNKKLDWIKNIVWEDPPSYEFEIFDDIPF